MHGMGPYLAALLLSGISTWQVTAFLVLLWQVSFMQARLMS
jgi:type IV secretory pathway TrbD component